jgi:hypothetical protein
VLAENLPNKNITGIPVEYQWITEEIRKTTGILVEYFLEHKFQLYSTGNFGNFQYGECCVLIIIVIPWFYIL